MGNKRITNVTKSILFILNSGLFAIVWFLYYNQYAFQTHFVFGGVMSLIIFCFIYSSLCRLYKAHRIASSQIGETVFSQVISFGITDLILYIECCLISNHYVNIMPGITTVILQIIGTMIIVVLAKRYFMKYVPAKKTLLVYGDEISLEEAKNFVSRILKKYSHLFEFVSIQSEKLGEYNFINEIEQCETIILYEVSCRKREMLIQLCMERQKNFYFTPRLEDLYCQGCTPKHLLDTPLMKYEYKYERRNEYFLKRTLDIVLSVAGIILLAPLLVITAVCIKLEDGGPVLFKQKRCTKNAKVFEILKFRSMIVDAEKNGATPCTDYDDRITKTGKWIRATRIDELPQLFNVLKGEMSFVGPRPERVEHVEKYTRELPEFAYRLRVKGGLTGYAQIFGKYNTSAYDKLRLDMMYIENQGLLLDLRLIMLTIRTVFQKESTEGFEEITSIEMNKLINVNK